MEEKILEIIDKTADEGYVYDAAGKKIADMFRAFILWKDFEDYRFVDSPIHSVYESVKHPDEKYSIDDLFQYWLTNIYKK